MSTPVEPWRNDLPFSIVLVGDVAVGITSMLRRYVDDTFSDWSCYKGELQSSIDSCTPINNGMPHLPVLGRTGGGDGAFVVKILPQG